MLQDILVVYFWEPGGLVRAYTEAVVKAVDVAKIVEQEEGYEAEIVISYQDIEKFKYYCEKNNIKILNIEYTENIKCIIEITEKEKDMFSPKNIVGKIIDILKFKIIGKKYIIK